MAESWGSHDSERREGIIADIALGTGNSASEGPRGGACQATWGAVLHDVGAYRTPAWTPEIPSHDQVPRHRLTCVTIGRLRLQQFVGFYYVPPTQQGTLYLQYLAWTTSEANARRKHDLCRCVSHLVIHCSHLMSLTVILLRSS